MCEPLPACVRVQLREIDSLKQDIKEKEALQETTRVQMIRLAKELARMRQEERERSQRDLEKLRVEYLAREGRYVLDGDRATLRDIRQQLENLSHTQ